MSDYEWFRYSGQEWHQKNHAPNTQPNFHESDPPRPLILNHLGEPMGRPKQPIGFRLNRGRE